MVSEKPALESAPVAAAPAPEAMPAPAPPVYDAQAVVAAPVVQQHQPSAVDPMIISNEARNAKGVPRDSQTNEREWSNGFCSCFGEFGTCCVAYVPASSLCST
jgi:hypothetical protein